MITTLRLAAPLGPLDERGTLADAPIHIRDQARAAYDDGGRRNWQLDAEAIAKYPNNIRTDNPADPDTIVHQLLVRHTDRVSREPRLVCTHDHIIEPAFAWSGRHLVICCMRRPCLAAAFAAVLADWDAADYCAICGPVEPGTARRFIEASLMFTRMQAPLCRHHRRTPPSPVGRNKPCPCGSGTKYKRCHGAPR